MVLQIKYRQKPLRKISKGLLLTANRFEDVPGTKTYGNCSCKCSILHQGRKNLLKREKGHKVSLRPRE